MNSFTTPEFSFDKNESLRKFPPLKIQSSKKLQEDNFYDMSLVYLQHTWYLVRSLKTAVLLLSLHPLPDQCLLHLHPTHLTDLLTYLPQAPAGDFS